MSEEKPLLHLPARLIIVWLVLIVGITGSTLLSTADYVTGGSLFSLIALWVIRLVAIGSFWLLEARKDTKIFAMLLVLLSLVLDILLKLPVLDTVEYGDWFLVSALDLTGMYTGYFTVWGIVLPVLSLAGWFILRPRKLAGWIVGLLSAVGLGFVALSVAGSASGSVFAFTLATLARYLVPALLAAAADFLAAKLKERKK
ncbi:MULTISPECIES: hypothetical protein [Glutamicibacter]|uniref:hypothetical protein n=1 Tax=Glutamicibacter TaxID=1742989 RepID=UPI000EF94C08|nr:MULTISPECIES: hypothetical protein [Glutamicibacter]UTM46320.1 hypothetical protein XH9_12215 [Glutamicibacter mysorens]WIV43335.1 hypothetical protein QQS42_13600 [Glutamicibacter nicotianae]